MFMQLYASVCDCIFRNANYADIDIEKEKDNDIEEDKEEDIEEDIECPPPLLLLYRMLSYFLIRGEWSGCMFAAYS